MKKIKNFWEILFPRHPYFSKLNKDHFVLASLFNLLPKVYVNFTQRCVLTFIFGIVSFLFLPYALKKLSCGIEGTMKKLSKNLESLQNILSFKKKISFILPSIFFLKKAVAFTATLSLLWSNYLWAQGPVRIIGEDYEHSFARTYVGHKVGVVDPGYTSEGAAHNIFDEFQLPPGSGVIFKGDTQADIIFNRIYSKNPVHLSGVIQSNASIPIVFANQEGLNLENPDFKNIPALTLVAGGIAKTDKGMAYGVGKGIVNLKKTIFEEENALKKLTLAGRGLQISQSILAPQDGVDLTIGQHIGSLSSKKDLEHPTAFIAEGTSPFPFKSSVVIDRDSILRSKSLRLRSFDEGAAIACLGLLQSTNEDIHIQAKGDVYLNHLLAARNLHIETTGNVFIGSHSWVGGTVNIKAKDIHIEQGLSSIGKALLQASGILNLEGNLSCEDVLSLRGDQAVNLLGTIASKGGVEAESQGEVFQTGFLYSGNALDIKGKSFRKKGRVLSEGPLRVETENNIENEEGTVSSLSKSHFISQRGKIINKGEITGEDPITFTAPQTENYGFLQTQSQFNVEGFFINKKKGQVGAKSALGSHSLFSQNEGEISLTDSLILKGENSLLKGIIKTQGRLEATGSTFKIEGDISAQQGTYFNLKNLTNLGKLSAFGGGLQGTIETFTNEGKLDLSTLKATIRDTTNKENGAIRTRGHFLLQGNHYTNKGKVFTCGVHETALEGSYKDYGDFYSPYLYLLKARNIEFHNGQCSFLKEGVIDASYKFTAGEKVSFSLESNVEKCFLQISSQGDLHYNGEIRQFSNMQFPFADYFKIINETAERTQELINGRGSLSFEAWKNLKRKLGSGVTLRAGGDLSCQKSFIQPESGSVTLVAEGKIQIDKANIKSGYFTGNNALMKGKKAVLEESQLTSLFGSASLIANDSAQLVNSHIKGKDSAFVMADIVDLEQGSSVQSSHGSTVVEGFKRATLKDSHIKGKSSATLRGENVTTRSSQLSSEGTSHLKAKNADLNTTKIQGKSTLTVVDEQLTISLSSLESEFNRVRANSLQATSLATQGTTIADITEEMSLSNLQAEGIFKGNAKKINLSETTKAQTLDLEGNHIRNTSNIEVPKHLNLKAKKLEQLGTTKSEGTSYLEGTEAYIGTKDTRNEAVKSLSIIAENNTDLEGQQKSDLVTYKFRDANLVKLLNQTEARTTEAHLKEGEVNLDTNLTFKTNLHLWAKKLENKAKLTASGDFIAHIQMSILNKGVMDIHGKAFLKAKESITNLGDVSGQESLGFQTDGTFTHKGNASSNGLLSVQAKKIDADAEVHTYQGTSNPNNLTTVSTRKARFIIPSFSGKDIHLESETSLNARGAQFKAQQDLDLIAKEDIHLDAIPYSEGDQEISVDFSQLGLPSLTTKIDPRNKFLQGSLTSGGNVKVSTSGKLDGRGLKVNSGGHIVLQADKGVDLSSLAALSVVERWNYNTGIFGQNNHRGFREGADFYGSELISQNGGIFIISKVGGITAKGTAFQAQDEIRLDAKEKVDIGSLKTTVRYASHDETGLGGTLGSIDDKEGSTEKLRQFETVSNKKIGIFSKEGTIEGDLFFMRAPEIELDGEKGIFFRPLDINSSEDTHHYENNLNVNLTNVEFEHKEEHTKTKILQQLAGTFQGDLIKVRTGKGAETILASNISGFKQGGPTDFEADTDKLTFSGIKSTFDRTTDSWSVSVSIDVNMTPGGGFEVSQDKLHKINYGATTQKFGIFHNKRKGAKLVVEGGAQTTIEESKGEDLYVLVDHNAQDKEAQEGHSFGAKVSSSGGGAHVSAKGGEKKGKDNLTSLKIARQSNQVTRKDVEHESKDTRWGVGVGVQFSDKGVSSSLNVQSGDTKIGVTVPLDEKALKTMDPTQGFKDFNPTNLQSLSNATNSLAQVNQTLNNLGVNTGDIGKGISQMQQATSIANETSNLFNPQNNESPSLLKTTEKVTGILENTASLATQLGADTEELTKTLKGIHSIVSTINNTNEFTKGFAKNFKPKPLAYEESRSGTQPLETPQEEFLPSANDSMDLEETADTEDEVTKQQPKKKKRKFSQRKPASNDNPPHTKKQREDGKTAVMQEDISNEKFINKAIAQRKAQYQRERKTWGEKEEKQAREEAQREIGGIEQVTWHEDVLSGGVGLGRSLIKGGLKEGGKFLAKKGMEIAQSKIEDETEELVIEGMEQLGIDPEETRKYTTAARMTGGFLLPTVLKGKESSSPPQSKESHSKMYKRKYKTPIHQEKTFPAKTHEETITKTDRYKEQLLERPGKNKWKETTLHGAFTESKGGKTEAAILKRRDYDHITKVENTQQGLLNHIENLNKKLGKNNLPEKERLTLEQELREASVLLDDSEGFIPRKIRRNTSLRNTQEQ